MITPRRCAQSALMIAGLCVTGVLAQPANDSLIGRWYVDDSTAIFDFYRVGNEYRARIIPLAIPDMLDTRNPVDSLRGRRVNGATLVYGLTYSTEKKRWDRGTVYNPEDGKTYFCNCRLTSAGARLLFRGYLGVSVLGSTRTWTRIAGDKTRQ